MVDSKPFIGFTSIVFMFLVQMKLFRFQKVWKQLQRKTNVNRALSKFIQELKMKDAKRIKISSIKIKWKPLNWYCRYYHLLCLLFKLLPNSFSTSSERALRSEEDDVLATKKKIKTLGFGKENDFLK